MNRLSRIPLVLVAVWPLCVSTPASAAGQGSQSQLGGTASLVYDEAGGYTAFPFAPSMELHLDSKLPRKFLFSSSLGITPAKVQLHSLKLDWKPLPWFGILAGYGRPDSVSSDAYSSAKTLSVRESLLDGYLKNHGFRPRAALVELFHDYGPKPLPVSYSAQFTFDGSQFTPESFGRFALHFGGKDGAVALWTAWAPRWLADGAGRTSLRQDYFGGLQTWNHQGLFQWEAAGAWGRALVPYPGPGASSQVASETVFYGARAFVGSSIALGALDIRPAIGGSMIQAVDSFPAGMNAEALAACGIAYGKAVMLRIEGGSLLHLQGTSWTPVRPLWTASVQVDF
ncbi:MAG: hypothetical protein WCQ50_17380 [Spirochaetota bacterium]